MSLSVYATLAVGVRADLRVSNILETRYHERTGKPYQINVEKKQYFLEGTNISILVFDEDFDDDENDESLSFVLHYYDYYENTNLISFIEGDIVGLVLRRISEYQSIESASVSYANIEDAIASVSRQLSDHYNYTGEIKVFLVKELSN